MIISWNTTNQCNMFCRHCYRDAGVKASKELSTAKSKLVIDEIILKVKQNSRVKGHENSRLLGKKII